MNKSKLNHLMVAGITSGVLCAHSVHGATPSPNDSLMQRAAETGGNVAHYLMTEDELLIQLNDEGAQVYKSLSPEGKQLALSVASRSCNGTNECAGLNACATDSNKCAGLGTCKGQTKCAISDPNLAVKLVAKKMAEKREKV
jgi:hypothetical protein